MPVRWVALVSLLLSSSLPAAQRPAKLSSLLEGRDVVAIRLEAPLQRLFETGKQDEGVFVQGTLTSNGAVFSDVEVSVRGHTSRNEDECTFPKLKLKLKGAGSLRIGTHCGDAPDDQLSSKYGRLANEKSPRREGLTYRILEALGVPVLRTRAAQITYVDTEAGTAPMARHALLIEDDDAAMTRVGGRTAIDLAQFANVKTRHAEQDALKIAFGEAAIANFDWCLKFAPDDIYRCNDPKPLWNVLAFDLGDGRTALMMKDFDLAGTVVGHHGWFESVFNPAFVPSRSETEIDVLSQVQRARSLFPRATLDALRGDFAARKAAAYDAVRSAEVDDSGRTIARAHLDAFYKSIGDAAAFYLPVVSRADVQVYKDPARSAEACGEKDTARVGTPVRTLQQSAGMSEVVLLDAMWRWGTKDPCRAVRTGPVWIDSSAISTNFPPK